VRRAAALYVGIFLMGSVLIWGAAAALAKQPHGSATQVGAGQCVKKSRDDQRSCVEDATKHCRDQFETGLVDCFKPDVDCPRKCLSAHTTCQAAPKSTEDGCKLACGSDLKVALDDCRKKADVRDCDAPARVTALKCKQRCSAESAPKLQECIGDFDDCIAACVHAAK
jgi:hypothetical protein